MHKYSYVIDRLTKTKQNFKKFFTANIIMEQATRIVNEEPARDTNLPGNAASTICEDKRNDRLSVVATGGNSKKYFCKEYTIAVIENLNKVERAKLYSRYEAKLGREIIYSFGSSIVHLYARALGSSLNYVDFSGYKSIDDEDDLITDLGQDPFISEDLHFINS